MSAGLLVSFLLVLTRVSGFFAFIPLPGGKNGPEAARVALAVGFTLALFPNWPALGGAMPSLGQLVGWILAEALLGAGLGLALACVNEAFLMTAQIAGLQAGYGYAATIDPTTQVDATVLLVFAQLIAGLLFFAVGLDRDILRALARSLDRQPPGQIVISGSAIDAILHMSAAIFSTGLRLAMPVVALLALVDIALALLGRLNNQLQLILLAFPVKMMAALALLTALAALFPRIYAANAREALRVAARLVGQ